MENRSGVVFNITGGQVNFAKDNATIHAIQNNGIGGNELDVIIKGIKENLSALNEEDAERVMDAVDTAKEELAKPEPKKGRLKNCISVIVEMVTLANGVPVLVDNLQKLQDFIEKIIK